MTPKLTQGGVPDGAAGEGQRRLEELAERLESGLSLTACVNTVTDPAFLRNLASRIGAERKHFEEDLLSDEVVEAVADTPEHDRKVARRAASEALKAATLSVSREGGR